MAAPGKGLAVGPIAQTILAAIVAHYEQAAGVSLPQRQIIAPGNSRGIAWDCEQCVVCLTGIGIGSAAGEQPGPRSVGNQVSAMGMRHAVLPVQIVRHSPESTDGLQPPPAEDMTKAGLALMRDAGLLSQALVDACTQVGASGLPKGSRVTPGAVEVLGPEGGFCAVEGSIAVTVGLLA